MSLSNELNQGITSALGSVLGTVKLFHLQAPDDEPLPFVVCSWQGGGRVGNVPDLVDRLEFVRAYGTSAYQAGTVDAAIAGALDGKNIAVSGWTTCTMMRQDDYESVDNLANGELSFTMGGIYRIVLDR